jgi:hypothetical protein
MSVQSLESIKQQIASLSRQEQAELSEFLAEQMRQDRAASSATSLPPEAGDAAEAGRRQRMEWMKANQAEYGGQYVALDGSKLVAVGQTFPEAARAAHAAGVAQPFVTYLPKPDEVGYMGGW